MVGLSQEPAAVIPALRHKGGFSVLCSQPSAVHPSLFPEKSEPPPGPLWDLQPCGGQRSRSTSRLLIAWAAPHRHHTGPSTRPLKTPAPMLRVTARRHASQSILLPVDSIPANAHFPYLHTLEEDEWPVKGMAMSQKEENALSCFFPPSRPLLDEQRVFHSSLSYL